MFWILIIVSLLHRASTTQITGYGSTTAFYGGDAHYRCAVDNPTGVLQVTWQSLHVGRSIENMATYSKRFGQQVNEPYRGKVIFTEASLNSSSITLKNVTWEDDNCYVCSFNVYPDGSKQKQTCLTVQGISEVNTSHTVSSEQQEGSKEVVVSCSATGKPAPKIEWDFSSGATKTNQPQTMVVTNSDRTSTSSSSIILKVHPDWEGHVNCVLNGGTEGERKERITFNLQKGTKHGLSPTGVALVATAVIFISCIAVAAVILKNRLKNKNKAEAGEPRRLDQSEYI